MSISTLVRPSAPEPEPQGAGLRALFQSAAVKTFAKNSLIFTEGSRPADSVYMVESGLVKLFMSNTDGKEIEVGVIGPGEIFGDTELDFGPRSVSAMTVEPSRLAVARHFEFRRYVEANPEFAMELILKLIARNRELLKSVKSLALMDVSDRVAQLLLEMATEEDGKLIINQKVSKRNIANRVGATREMASRVFRDLVASGYIQMENKKITVSRKMAGMLAAATVAGLAFMLFPADKSPLGVPDPVVASINDLPATAAGRPSSVGSAESGAIATGRVAHVYIKSAEGVLIETGSVPDRLKQGAQRWAEVQFPDPVAGTAGPVLALLGDAREQIGAGDIVEVRLAPARDARATTDRTDREPARVTALVERKDGALAREFERRILARREAPAVPPKQVIDARH